MQDYNKNSDYYQHSAFVLRIFKYISILLFVVFLISCIVIFRKDITLENMQLLAKFINIDVSSSVHAEEFSTTANDESDVVMLRDNLAVINKNNISLYDLTGQKLFSYNISLSSPAVVNDNHSIVVHDIDGNTLTVFNSFSKIKDFKYSGNVLSADVNDNYISVITEDETFNSLLKVYCYDYHERDFIDMYTLKSSHFLTSSAISHSGRFIVAASVESSKGSYKSSVNLYDTTSNSSTPISSYSIKNELPVKVGFADNNATVFVITDSAIHFLSDKFESSNVFRFNQSKVEKYYESDEMLIITEHNNLSGNSVLLTALSKYGDVIFEINISDEIYDIAIGKNKVFALGKQSIYEITKNKDDVFKITNASALSTRYFGIVCDTSDNCFVIGDAFVTKVNFNE